MPIAIFVLIRTLPPLLQLEQPPRGGHVVGHAVVLALFLEDDDGIVKNLVDDGPGQDFDVHAFRRRQALHPRAGFLELGPYDAFRLFLERHDGGNHPQCILPALIVQDLLADDGLRPFRFLPAAFHVFVHNVLEVVDVVEEDVVDVPRSGIDVPRDGDVDEEQEAVLPSTQRCRDHRSGDHVSGCPRRADDDVRLAERFFQAFKGNRPALERFGHLQGPHVGPVCDQDLRRPVGDQVTGGQLGHLAGADEQDRLPLQSPEDLLGQLDRGEADGNRVGGNPRLRPHPLGDAESVVQDPVQNDARRPAFRRPTVGFLDLSQNLRFAHDQGVEAGGDPEQVADRLLVTVQVEATVHLLRGEVPVPKDEALQLLDGGRIVRGLRQHFDPVAGGQVDDAVDLRDVDQLPIGVEALLAGQGKPFPDVQGGCFVVHSDEDEIHGFTGSCGRS